MIDWTDFQSELASVLAELGDGVRLIVRARTEPEYYVQCANDDDKPLSLEAVSDAYLPQQMRIGADGASALGELGWQRPRETPGNWWHDIDWPARTSDCATGAAMMVGALRTVYGVTSPDDLTYTAWRESAGEVEYAALGLEPVPLGAE